MRGTTYLLQVFPEALADNGLLPEKVTVVPLFSFKVIPARTFTQLCTIQLLSFIQSRRTRLCPCLLILINVHNQSAFAADAVEFANAKLSGTPDRDGVIIAQGPHGFKNLVIHFHKTLTNHIFCD